MKRSDLAGGEMPWLSPAPEQSGLERPGPERPGPERIAIVTDAWLPQMNGVVRTLTTTCDNLRALGHEVMVISPDQFASIPCPTYPEIRLALTRPGAVASRLREFAPNAIHIATEGPLGLAARRYCCLLYTSPSPRDRQKSRMPSSA